MGVSETNTSKIGHWVAFYPDHVVEDPISQIHQNLPDSENVVVAADDPNGTRIFEHVTTSLEPVVCKAVVLGKIGEMIPLVVDRIDLGQVRSP